MEALGTLALMVLAATPSLECRLEIVPPVTPRSVAVRFTVRNTGPAPVAVLEWLTPLEGLLGDILEVTDLRDGRHIPYDGPLVKRGDPDAEDYRTIAVGGEASGTIDASKAYDVSRPGRYRVSFTKALLDTAPPDAVPRPRSAHKAVPLACRPVEFEVPALSP